MGKGLFFSLMVLCISANAQTNAPAIVKTAFAKQFPDARNVKWGKENATEFEANFRSHGMAMSANYDLKGNWKETETTIAVKDLPQTVIKSIHEKYLDAIISDAARIEKPDGSIIYEVEIKVNGKRNEVELLADGKFVK